jgi:hypothetical protein
MSVFPFYAKFILMMAFLLNTYKFIPMLLYYFGILPHYYIFPWQDQSAQVSRSSGLWLCIHLLTALPHVLMTYNEMYPLKWISYFDQFKQILRVLFELIIAINVWNFGEFTYGQAILINGGLLVVTHFCYNSHIKMYYTLMTMPILLETVVIAPKVIGYLLSH